MVDPAPLHDPLRDVFVVPVRHHSPACAAQLAALLDQVQPAAVLVEGPCDFDPLIPLICDARTRPPVAVVALRQLDGAARRKRATSYFPFSAHSPEYVALRHAHGRQVASQFIDLPSHARAMLFDGEGEPARTLQGDETLFDSGDYVTALARDLGCRDGNEVWDQLFETRIADADWRRFFADVGQYCACIRAATAQSVMETDGTLEREVQMRALVARARAATQGPIVVVVGGFHASAMFGDHPGDGAPVPPSGSEASSYLVRYGNRQLDALAGYSAGLPLPGFYQHWWDWHHCERANGATDDWAGTLIGGFVAHLRGQGRAPSFPVMLSAIEQAKRLASLRGRPLPLRDDVIDAVRSTFIKDEIPRAGAALLQELHGWLTGSAIGDVPPAAGSPPLVEAVRSEARRLRFVVDDGEIRTRNLDIYRKETHREASRFCHALALVGAGFGQRTAGPDFRNDVALDRLFEVWSVGWSPMVEARLIEVSELADSLPEAVIAVIAERIAALAEQGLGRNAEAAIDLFATACRAGAGESAGAILQLVEAEVIEDAELRSVVAALSDAVLLRRGHKVLGISDPAPIDQLMHTIWRRVLVLLPELAAIPADQARPALQALADLRGVIEIARSAGFGFDLGPFDEALARLEAQDLAPAIAGAVMAFALLDGRADGQALGLRLQVELAGAYLDAGERLAFVGGIIAISRELLWTVPQVVEALDAVVGDAEEDDFIAMLPHLRLALMPLDPGEIDRLSTIVAERLGISPDALAQVVAISEDEALRNAALDRELARKLEAEGVA
ncbi:MAG: hypothetical protein KDE15_02955 [Erythrobacter sp.]|nr:hypothetical protein [Erythrobacter sp.]